MDKMETNIFGLPSLTGYTPLKAALEGQVLKYDFRGIGPIAVDKSGHGNLGRLMPRKDPPRRKIVSWFPLQVVMFFDGKDDFIKVSDDPSLDFGKGSFSIEIQQKTSYDGYQPYIYKRKSTRSYVADDSGLLFRQRHNRPEFAISDGTNISQVLAFTHTNDGKFHTIKAVREAGKEIRIYVDDLDEPEDTSPDNVGSVDNDLNLLIGKLGTRQFDGSISKVIMKERTE